MYQLFPPSDRYFARCGGLDATVVERRISGAPDFMRGLRALFVADVHVLPRTTDAQLDAFAGKLAGLNPDMLLLGGDYSDRAEGAVRLFEALKAVSPPLGKFGVPGNNDAEAWEGQPGGLRAAMARGGCRLLVNESVSIARNGSTILIAGIDEYRYGSPRASGLLPVLPAPGLYRVLLSHYPIDPGIRPELMLCGHTHGGQFNLLGLTPFAIGFERLKRPSLPAMAVSGLHDADGMALLVSKGVGASRIQLRAGVRPEIDLLAFD